MFGDAIRKFQEDNSHLHQLLEQNMQQQSQTFLALREQVDQISTRFSAVSCHTLPPSSPSGYYLVRKLFSACILSHVLIVWWSHWRLDESG